MDTYYVKLRFFPEDPLEEIKEPDLKCFEKDYKVTVAYEKIENRILKDGLLMENTMDKPIEEISQEVITVSSNSESEFLTCLKALYKKYRCPRTSYGLWGSNKMGQKLAKGLMDVYGGW
jgi:hypothetical protein